MESMKKEPLTIKLKLENPASTQPLENYADKSKINRNEPPTKSTTDTRSGTRQNRDPRYILLLIKTNQKFRDSIESKTRLLPYILTTKNYGTPILKRVVVNIFSLKHHRRLTVFCKDGRQIF